MVKVYDMDTFGVCEPTGEAAPMLENPPAAGFRPEVPQLGLQLIEAAPLAARPTSDHLPASLRAVDAEEFLKLWDK